MSINDSSRRQESDYGRPGHLYARNHLTGRREIPFGGIDDETRAAIERRTGRTLEQSYEGLTWKLSAVLDDLFKYGWDS